MKLYQFTEKGLTELANQVKDRLAHELNISELDDYVVVVTTPNIFGRMWQAITGYDSSKLSIVILQNLRTYSDGPDDGEEIPEETERPRLKVVGV